MQINDHIISADATLIHALERLNDLSGHSAMALMVTDDVRAHLVGTLTDGDVRRALIAGHSTSEPVSVAMCRNFSWLPDGPATPEHADRLRVMRQRGITLVPRLDAEGCLVNIIDLRTTRALLPVTAILMAGGKGERLRPLTLTTPKPLLKIDGKPIIDYNVEALAACGITDITVTTRYLAEQIHAHFANPVAGVSVKCINEGDVPLGTLGSATLIERPDHGDTLVMNSDLLTTVDFEQMYIRHRDTDADVTVAVTPYQVSIPYAILATDGHQVTGIEEKPAYTYFANAGIYIIRNSLLNSLTPRQPIHTPDLIERVLADGGRVVHHPVNGTWIDVGSPAEFAHAADLMRHHRNLSAIPS